MTSQRLKRPDVTAGFTLNELLVVAAIVAVMVAFSIPAIAQFLRNYRIQGAVQEIAAEMQRARGAAISKNVNWGVVFLVTSPTTYRFVVEDPQKAGDPPIPPRPTLDGTFLGNPAFADRVFPERVLPQGVEFAGSAVECPASTRPPVSLPFAPSNFSVRFTRLGAACIPSGAAEPCPEVTPARPSVIMNGPDGGAVLCVREVSTGLSRALLVLPSGQPVNQE